MWPACTAMRLGTKGVPQWCAPPFDEPTLAWNNYAIFREGPWKKTRSAHDSPPKGRLGVSRTFPQRRYILMRLCKMLRCGGFSSHCLKEHS